MTDTVQGRPDDIPQFFEGIPPHVLAEPRRNQIDALNEFLALFLSVEGAIEMAGLRRDREVVLLMLEAGREVVVPTSVSARETFLPRATSFVLPKHAALFAVFHLIRGFNPELRPVPDSAPATYQLVVSLS